MTEDGCRDAVGETAASIRRTIQAHLPLALRDQAPHDATHLGREGAGLDSVALVELLLACEEATGIPFTADVLADGPLTIGHLVRHAVAHSQSVGSRASS